MNVFITSRTTYLVMGQIHISAVTSVRVDVYVCALSRRDIVRVYRYPSDMDIALGVCRTEYFMSPRTIISDQ